MTPEAGSLHSLMRLVRGYAPAKILTTAGKLGLFSPPFEALTPKELSSRRHISEKGARYLLNALVALGVFEKRENTYRLEKNLQRELERFPEFAWELTHQDHLYEVWRRLEAGIRTGHSPDPPAEELADYPASLKVFLWAMHSHARLLFPELVSAIPWDGVSHLLDIGGGGAGFALSLTRRYEALTVTLMDLPDAVVQTREIIAGNPGEDRIVLKTGNTYNDPLPEGPFDRILISHLIHIYPETENRKLIEKAACRLKPGGDLLLLDFFLEEDETTPPEAVFFRLLMLIGTPEGDCYPLSSARAWFVSAGLAPERAVSLSGGNTLLIGRRP